MRCFTTSPAFAAQKWLRTAICALVLLAASETTCMASPMLFGSNYYEFVQVSDPFTGTNNSWATASAAASASTFIGINGHLATVTSQAENDFLLSLVPAIFGEGAGAWLGGKQPDGWLEGPETGQGFAYTNWGGSEPNNNGYAYMIVGTVYAGVNPGKWADDDPAFGSPPGNGVPDAARDRVIGYFVEYEGSAVVPEPSSWLLLTSGLVGLVFLKQNPSRSRGPGKRRANKHG